MEVTACARIWQGRSGVGAQLIWGASRGRAASERGGAAWHSPATMAVLGSLERLRLALGLDGEVEQT